MKKSTKIYVGWWCAMFGVMLITVLHVYTGIFSFHRCRAKVPGNVEIITGVDLPNLKNIDSWDNLDRGSSRWDCFSHSAEFEEPLSENCIRKLEKLCQTQPENWSKFGDNKYSYHEGDGDDEVMGEYSVTCNITRDSCNVTYYIDESEGLEVTLAGVAIIIIGILVLLLWGLVRIVIRIRRQHLDNWYDYD
ncbi:MAG: hypothetical protein IKU16_08065 [Muribaculaceae bacterium]|nr:hypothetical protein [Muribaculaceae bacterium]